MPYEFPEAEKVRTLKVLIWLARHEWATGSAVCVYDLDEALGAELGADYSTKRELDSEGKNVEVKRSEAKAKNGRFNDASQRLRMLCKSGYLTKIGATYFSDEPFQVSAADCAAMIDRRLAGRRGRRPEMYVLTPRGHRYSASYADQLRLPNGSQVDREEFVSYPDKQKEVVGLFVALSEDGSVLAFWAKKDGAIDSFAKKHVENLVRCVKVWSEQ